jgi:hypothetical protein
MNGFVGLDVDIFPGLEVMKALKAGTNAVWVGYYLRAPSHYNGGWAGQRAALIKQGWSVVPVYVGQQITGPGSHDTTAAQGAIDGADCAARMIEEGFPEKTCVWLDLENGAPFSPPQSDYVGAWVKAVREAGFAQGVYCSHAMAQEVALDNPGVRIWAFRVETTERTFATSPFAAADPADSGFPNAKIWQHADNVQIAGPGFWLVVDLDVATTADPSAP